MLLGLLILGLGTQFSWHRLDSSFGLGLGILLLGLFVPGAGLVAEGVLLRTEVGRSGDPPTAATDDPFP